MSTLVSDLDVVMANVLKALAREEHLPITAFALLHGNGNVIAVVELAAQEDVPLERMRRTTVVLCGHELVSTRIDGALFFYPRHVRGLRMVFFDRDGTWEAMCGNGLRCLTRYAADTGAISGDGIVVTDDGAKEVFAHGDQARVTLGKARQVQQLDATRWFAYTGVAHLVVFVEDHRVLGSMNVAIEGADLRYDRELCASLGHPDGVHVDFASVDRDQIAIRTYEVGVEDETLCCGTGVAATAYVAWLSGRVAMPVCVQTLGGTVEVALAEDQLSIMGQVSYLVPRQVLATDMSEAGGLQ